ncbi:WAT1-related protein At5g64700-like isoform X2 [Herrania umbratica]|uniref:WAT1-related protein n=1 Tax=Herrania umbratica TaxID=108875 RepID=A0A6J1BNR5_9ROSI|nr:WAT1-related protein At5g64700-like isoform X2 [Herrania umbratica]
MGSKKPFLAALLVHALSSGMTLLSKAAFNMGMSTSVFVFYRQVAGTIFLAPFAMIFEGKSAKPLSLLTFCKIFMLALLGITLTLNLYGVALIYTSASLGAATINCIPVITFAFAVLLRMEKVTVKTVPGIAKVAGILVSMAGVVTLAFYKGPVLQPLCHLHFQPHSGQDHHADGHASSGKKWILGCFLLLVSCICWALWLVIQGIFVTGVAYYLQAWVIAMKGPVFHAVMTPSNLVMTILGSVFLLGETINLGSVLGAILLVISLYSVLWGKSTEQNMDNNLGCLPVQAQTDCSTQVKETPVLSSNPRPSLSM